MKKVLNRITGFFFLSMMMTMTAYAENVTVTASLDRNPITLEDQAVLTLSVSGADNAAVPVLPDLPDFNVASSGRATRVSIVNGAMSSQTDYHFVLQPRKTGDFTIGAAIVQYKGKTYGSSPLIIHVTKSGGTAGGGRDVFITTEVDRSAPYVGEQILFRLKFFRRINVANASLEDLSFNGFQAADAGKETVYAKVVDGISYQVTEIRKLLMPSRAGNITIPAAVLQCQVPVEGSQRTRNHTYEDFFNFGIQKTVAKVLRSQPLHLQVRSLPQEGKPAAFSGMVGVFRITAELDKTNIKKGESVTLTIKLSGRGDLTGAPRPTIQGLEQFKTYDDQPVTSKNIVNERVVSEKIFKTALVPLYAGDLKSTEVSFWYFDPDAGKYQRTTAVVPGFHVSPAEKGDHTRVGETKELAAAKQNVQLMSRDILPISTDFHSFNDETFRPLAPFMLVLLLTPPLAFLAIVVIRRKHAKLASDIGFMRSSKAMKQSRKGLEEAARLAEQNDAGKCCALLSRTFKIYLGDKLNVSGEAMTPDELKEALVVRIGHGRIAERVMTLLHELEIRQFASTANPPEGAGKLVQEAREVMLQMEKTV